MVRSEPRGRWDDKGADSPEDALMDEDADTSVDHGDCGRPGQTGARATDQARLTTHADARTWRWP
jgi:hypothetical protein